MLPRVAGNEQEGQEDFLRWNAKLGQSPLHLALISKPMSSPFAARGAHNAWSTNDNCPRIFRVTEQLMVRGCMNGIDIDKQLQD